MLNSKIIQSAHNVLKKYKPACALPIYSSLDIRHSGYKISAVDANLFPAGFNQLSQEAKTFASTNLKKYLSFHYPQSQNYKLLIYPESHTNNKGYLQNILSLKGILENAQCDVKIAWSGDEIPKPWTLKINKDESITFEPFSEAIKDTELLLLNNDLSSGLHSRLQDLKVKTLPNPKLGWFSRKKSEHFEIVRQLLNNIKKELPDFDPWFFHPEQKTIHNISIDSEDNRKTLASEISIFIENLKKQKKKRGLSESPTSIFLKNEQGTYGMGVLAISESEDPLEVINKHKKQFRKGKNSSNVSNFLIQEGVETKFKALNSDQTYSQAEPTLYLCGGKLTGHFWRVHPKASSDQISNLNQPGSYFLSSNDKVSIKGQEEIYLDIKNYPPEYKFLALLHSIAASIEECPQD